MPSVDLSRLSVVVSERLVADGATVLEAAQAASEPREEGDRGVAVDIGTTTLRLLLIRLSDGVIVGEAGAQNPQIGRSGGGRDADPGGICGYLLAGNVAMA